MATASDSAAPAPGPVAPALLQTGHALGAMGRVNALGRRLDEVGIQVMVLKGPHLQQRLYGTPAAYPSGDVDILVPGRDGARTRAALVADGWDFEAANGVLWRLSRAATFARDGLRVDLHWGMHAAHMPAGSLHRLEKALWATARRRTDGLLEPSDAALVVYLALHAAGHGYERRTWTGNVAAAAALVTDWDETWALAESVGLRSTVATALAVADGAPPPRPGPVLDGLLGAAVWKASYLARGHVLPRTIRAAAAEVLERIPTRAGRERQRSVTGFGPIEISVEAGVFPPQQVTTALADWVVEHLDRRAGGSARVLDVGTGSGAVGLSVAARRKSDEIVGLDLSPEAVGCANRNARRLGLRHFRAVRSDVLAGMPRSWDAPGTVAAITCNLPYVPPAMVGLTGAPAGTVHGQGADALDLVRVVATRAASLLEPGGLFALQIADFQYDGFAPELADLGFVIDPPNRSAGHAIVVRMTRPSS